MSKRNAAIVTEGATAKERLVRTLPAYVKVEKDDRADDVVGVEHSCKTTKVGGNHQRQPSELASSAASME